MKIREARSEDFEKIYYLLKRLNDTSLNKDEWKKLSQTSFLEDDTTYGLVLDNEGDILGFIGTIYSERIFDGQSKRYCNIHSWIVDPKAKSKGMHLLLRVLKDKACVITNFSASEVPYKIFKQLKFREIDYKKHKLFPKQSNAEVGEIDLHLLNDEVAESKLNEIDLRLYHDHKAFENTYFIYLKTDAESCLIIGKKRSFLPLSIKKVPLLSRLLSNKFYLGEIHYLSNPLLFQRTFANSKMALKICKAMNSIGVIVMGRDLSETIAVKKSDFLDNRPYMYRNTDQENEIDTLYSELFVLNI